MRLIVKLILTAIATSLMLASCSDNLFNEENGIAQTGGTRVISVSFGNQTRTALGGEDGLTPQFREGDEILVANGVDEPQTCAVTFDENGNAIITTKLEGALTAVYPASAAKMDGNAIEGVKVSSVQDGTFANANICMASEIKDVATFENKTAILKFYVGEEIGVTSINVTSSGEEIADGSKTITVTASEGKALYDDMPAGQDRRICYVAVKSGANANTLTFATKTNTQGQQTKTSMVDATLAIGTMYNAFIPYYVEVGDQKWGYCNIGAFLPEEPGDYFAWGDTKGYKWDGKQLENNHNFNWVNCPFNGGSASFNSTYLNSVKDTEFPNGVLALKNDAANVNWGGNWRMPTKEEFVNLDKACGGTGENSQSIVTIASGDIENNKVTKNKYWLISGRTTLEDVEGLKDIIATGVLYSDGENYLFFPAAGFGENAKPTQIGESGHYWSSNIRNPSSSAYGSRFDSFANPQGYGDRYLGMFIRPIYDSSVPDGALPGVFTVGKGTDGIEGTKDDIKIHFSKGNLQAKYSNALNSYSWQFAADQYQHIVNAPGNTTIDSQSDGALVDLFSWSTSSTNYGITNSKTDSFFSGDFLDWGTAYCETNNVTPNTTWRTMSVEEWQYLLSFGDFTNDTRNRLYATGVKVLGQTNCVILYPDGYEGTKVSNNDNSTYNSKEAWDDAQNAGVVCLPPTSNRNGSTVFEVYNNDRLCYWTSSKINDSELFAWLVQYSNKKFEFEKINGVDGRSVRLVTNVK